MFRNFPRMWIYRWRGIIPVPFLILVLLLSPPAYWPRSVPDLVFDLGGVALLVGGLIIRIWAVGHAGPHTRSYKLRAPRLVMTGPYAHVRNPIYLGNFLIGLGIVGMTESWPALVVYVALFALEYGAIVSLEEEFLSERFGEAYAEYCRHVLPWVPRLSPARFGEAGQFSCRAVRKEYQAVLSALAMAVLVRTARVLQWLYLS